MRFPTFGREKKAFTPSPFRERVGVITKKYCLPIPKKHSKTFLKPFFVSASLHH